MDDPYCWPGTSCLRNKLGIRDEDELARKEARIASIRDVEISRTTLPGSYNLHHLQAFHRSLFQDVYAWAGETRTVDIHKGDSSFAHWRFIDDQVSVVLAAVADAGQLVGYSETDFLHELASLYGDLNAYHPFREGNGRCLRAFLRQLGAAAGYRLDWTELSRKDNVEACRANLTTGDTTALVAVLRPVVRRI